MNIQYQLLRKTYFFIPYFSLITRMCENNSKYINSAITLSFDLAHIHVSRIQFIFQPVIIWQPLSDFFFAILCFLQKKNNPKEVKLIKITVLFLRIFNNRKWTQCRCLTFLPLSSRNNRRQGMMTVRILWKKMEKSILNKHLKKM